MARASRFEDNPLHLQSSDHPGIALVINPLREKNYLQWWIPTETALGAKMKLGFFYMSNY